MAILNAGAITEKWQRRTAASTPDYVAGIRGVTEAPGQAAAGKKDKYLQGILDSVDKWSRRVAGVSLSSWQQSAIDKGAPRISNGVNAAAPKMREFLTDFLPFVENVKAQVKNMPDSSLEDRLNRMVTNARMLSEYKR